MGDKLEVKTILMIGIPIVTCLFVYILFFKPQDNKQISTSLKKERVVDLPESPTDTTVKTKVGVYKRASMNKMNRDVSNLDFYEVSDQAQEKVSEPVATPEPTRSRSSRFIDDEQEAPVRVHRANKRVIEPPVVQETPKPIVEESGFGISRNGGSYAQGSAVKQENKTNDNDFIPAYLEDNTKVKNRQPVVFILSSNCVIEGHDLKKNSILFGKATDTGNMFDIKISQAKNIDGTMISLKKTVVYNENYDRGIAHSGKMTKALKEAEGETTNDISSQASSSVSSIPGADLAVSAVDNTIKAMSRQKENEIYLDQGYKIFIKTEQ